MHILRFYLVGQIYEYGIDLPRALVVDQFRLVSANEQINLYHSIVMTDVSPAWQTNATIQS